MKTPAAGLEPIFVLLRLNDRGGAEKSMVTLAKGLTDAGRCVSLVVYGSRTSLSREFGFGGDVVDLKCERTLLAFVKLVRLLCYRKPGVLISALTHTNIIASVAGAFSGNKHRIIVTEHGIDGLELCQKSTLFRGLVRASYLKTAAIVTVSHGLASKFRQILKAEAKKVQTIYNPVVPDHEPAVAPAAHPWLKDAEIPVILGVGRLSFEKNFGLLIEAFADVSKTMNVRLAILGEGRERAQLEALVKRLGLETKVLLPGFISDVDAWLPHARLLVSTSRSEGFGNAIVEALSRGVPVVATDCPYGPREILEDGRYGLLVPMNNVSAVSSAIIRSLTATPNRALLRERGNFFNAKRCIDGYLGLVDNRPIS